LSYTTRFPSVFNRFKKKTVLAVKTLTLVERELAALDRWRGKLE
jgi:hypothetical protein